ncbi:YagK/YfjJ domain-containing protein [Candidatus Thioglobus autotrophicus]|uniref:YagK/YfjJ domain-containing protein n=1 Tax=Candidatus Thioglobus autotrophicus TaxID=1705394 RepID=UPI0006B47125|nr:inovirus-type Gp2 protein [Candidatus Thioglobus autotrophicus]
MKKPRNRKTVINDGWIDYNGEKIEICNSSKFGIYKKILLSFIEQLDTAIQIHGRVLVLRSDFHMNFYTSDNKIFSNYIKNIKQYLKRHYDITNIGYQWVREQEKAKKQHYHLVLMLDGNKIRHPSKLNKIMKSKWLPRGHMHIPENCFYLIDKDNIEKQRPEAIYRASYMAKSRGKGVRPAQTKDFYCSRLKLKNCA